MNRRQSDELVSTSLGLLLIIMLWLLAWVVLHADHTLH